MRGRIWFGEVIPALAFEPGPAPILSQRRHDHRQRVDCDPREACDRPAGCQIHDREFLKHFELTSRPIALSMVEAESNPIQEASGIGDATELSQ